MNSPDWNGQGLACANCGPAVASWSPAWTSARHCESALAISTQVGPHAPAVWGRTAKSCR